MATVTARATRAVDASPDRVLAFLRDYREARPRILTDNYSPTGSSREGRARARSSRYHFAAGGRERDYRLSVEENAGGLSERDQLSSYVSRWTVAPSADGSQVTLEATWQGAGGIGGVFERTFAPMGPRRIFGEMLDKLAAAVSA